MPDVIIRLDDGWKLDEGHHFDQAPVMPPAAGVPVRRRKLKPGTSIMDFIPPRRNALYLWLKNLSDNVVAEAAKIGASAADANSVKASADDLIAKMDATNNAQSALDGARDQERAASATDIANIRQKVRNWKTLTGYPASGSEAVLQLKGSASSFDPATYKPVITVSVVAGQVSIGFNKLGVDGLAIYCRLRGTVAWRKLAVDTEAPYVDTTPLAQAGTPEVREYMARGVLNDEEIGQESDIVSIAFGG